MRSQVYNGASRWGGKVAAESTGPPAPEGEGEMGGPEWEDRVGDLGDLGDRHDRDDRDDRVRVCDSELSVRVSE
jgi:hypothetical protein